MASRLMEGKGWWEGEGMGVIFTEHILQAKNLTLLSFLNPTEILWGRNYYLLCTSEETEGQ